PAKKIGRALHALVLEGEAGFAKQFAAEPSPEGYPGALVSLEDSSRGPSTGRAPRTAPRPTASSGPGGFFYLRMLRVFHGKQREPDTQAPRQQRNLLSMKSNETRPEKNGRHSQSPRQLPWLVALWARMLWRVFLLWRINKSPARLAGLVHKSNSAGDE